MLAIIEFARLYKSDSDIVIYMCLPLCYFLTLNQHSVLYIWPWAFWNNVIWTDK